MTATYWFIDIALLLIVRGRLPQTRVDREANQPTRRLAAYV